MQALVRRSRPGTAVKAEQPTENKASAPARRMVVGSGPRRLAAAVRGEEVRKEAESKIREDLQTLAKLDSEIDRIVAARDLAEARIEQLMREHRISVLDDGRMVASLEESFTRQSITIDPQKFKNKVTNAQFWGSIEVSVTKAREFLGEKEILGISDVKQSVSQGTKLKIREMKTRKK